MWPSFAVIIVLHFSSFKKSGCRTRKYWRVARSFPYYDTGLSPIRKEARASDDLTLSVLPAVLFLVFRWRRAFDLIWDPGWFVR